MSKTSLGSRWLNSLLIGIVALLLLHLAAQLVLRLLAPDNLIMRDVANRFNVDMELNLPTWFASMQALLAAALALLISWWQPTAQARLLWRLIAAGLLLLSLDEAAGLHELVLQGVHISARLGDGQTFQANAWLLLLPFIAAIAVVIAVWAEKQLPAATYRRLVLAGLVFVSGALVIEYLGIETDKESLRYNLGLAPLEESLELLGVWLVLRSQLMHIEEHLPQLKKRLAAIRQ